MLSEHFCILGLMFPTYCPVQVLDASGAWQLDGNVVLKQLITSSLKVLKLSHTAGHLDMSPLLSGQAGGHLTELCLSGTR